jgi:hypothetical protein
MSTNDTTRIRVDLARGHWQLGERAEAVACLERGAAVAPLHDGLLALVESCLEDLEEGGAEELALRLSALRILILDAADADEAADMPAPLATSTVARLLAEQGHPEKALAVADDVLRRNPSDANALAVRASLEKPKKPARALVIAELERWLANLSQLSNGGARA